MELGGINKLLSLQINSKTRNTVGNQTVVQGKIEQPGEKDTPTIVETTATMSMVVSAPASFAFPFRYVLMLLLGLRVLP